MSCADEVAHDRVEREDARALAVGEAAPDGDRRPVGDRCVNSRARRDLPMPGGPSSVTTCGRPRCARARARRRAARVRLAVDEGGGADGPGQGMGGRRAGHAEVLLAAVDRLDGLVARDVRRQACGERIDEGRAGSRGACQSRSHAHHACAADAVPARDELARADADGRRQGCAETLGERRRGLRQHVRHAGGGAYGTPGVVLVRLIQAERRERRVAGQHLRDAAVAGEEARQVVEDAPLDRAQALGIEGAVAARDLGELDVDHADEPPLVAALGPGPGSAAARGGSPSRGDGGSSAGSCSRIARSSSRSAVPGSSPWASRRSARRSR